MEVGLFFQIKQSSHQGFTEDHWVGEILSYLRTFQGGSKRASIGMLPWRLSLGKRVAENSSPILKIMAVHGLFQKNHRLSATSARPSLSSIFGCQTSLTLLASLPLRANATIMLWLNLAAMAVFVCIICCFQNGQPGKSSEFLMISKGEDTDLRN